MILTLLLTLLATATASSVAGILTDNLSVVDYLHNFVTVHDIRIHSKKQAGKMVDKRTIGEWSDDALKTLSMISVRVPKKDLSLWLSETVSLLISRNITIEEGELQCKSPSPISSLCDPVKSASLFRSKPFRQAIEALHLRFLLHHWQYVKLPKNVNKLPMDPQEALQNYYEALWVDPQTIAAGYFFLVVLVIAAIAGVWRGVEYYLEKRRKECKDAPNDNNKVETDPISNV